MGAKVVVNGQVVVPSKKVKLWDHKKPSEVQELIKKKKQEQLDEQPSDDQE